VTPAGLSTSTLVAVSNTRHLSLGAASAYAENWGNVDTAATTGVKLVALMKSRLFMAAFLLRKMIPDGVGEIAYTI
jgi:hypothetical protein